MFDRLYVKEALYLINDKHYIAWRVQTFLTVRTIFEKKAFLSDILYFFEVHLNFLLV